MTSLFDLYKIGVGPSSSHTMGPMRAAFRFVEQLRAQSQLAGVLRIQAELYGSLALTGIGHATDRAVLLGLSGQEPATVDPADIENIIAEIRSTQQMALANVQKIAFHEPADLLFHRDQMFPPGAFTRHPNGLRLTAFNQQGTAIASCTYFSIGGGFILEDGASANAASSTAQPIPYPFHSAARAACAIACPRPLDCRDHAGQRMRLHPNQ